MATTLILGNAATAFVRRRNRWVTAVLIPIQTEEIARRESAEAVDRVRFERIRHRVIQLFSSAAK